MPSPSPSKKQFVDNVNKHFGIKKRYVNILYDFLVGAMRDSIVNNTDTYVEGLGRFIHNTEGKLTIDFGASDRLKVDIKGESWDEFTKKKHRKPRSKSNRQKRANLLAGKEEE